MYKFGTIVLIPFPFTDLTSAKLRPALVVSKADNHFEDIVVCFISSKIPTELKNHHFLLKTNHKYFDKTGLKTDSIFRFDKIATLNKKLVLGELGSINEALAKEMKKNFLATFGF